MGVIRISHVSWGFLFLITLVATPAFGTNVPSPEEVIRTLIQANEEKDLQTLSALMAHDPDTIGYTIGGRKYIGWDTFAQEMQHEFQSVTRLKIPIKELRVWTRGDTAWFAMEIDYIRYVRSGQKEVRTVIPLRETGVLERRNGQWILVAWHESSGKAAKSPLRADHPAGTAIAAADAPSQGLGTFNLSGKWIIEEEDKSYTALLDREGNGAYSHKGGSFKTIRFEDRRLLGTWRQTENDREGGFEVVFSEDGNEAQGIWWYTRVGPSKSIPPREHGGTYVWRRAASH